jgi:hypothetical protein
MAIHIIDDSKHQVSFISLVYVNLCLSESPHACLVHVCAYIPNFYEQNSTSLISPRPTLFSKMKHMYSTIIMDCQTRTAQINCADCIAYKECSLCRSKQGTIKGNLELVVESPKLVAVAHR